MDLTLNASYPIVAYMLAQLFEAGYECDGNFDSPGNSKTASASPTISCFFMDIQHKTKSREEVICNRW